MLFVAFALLSVLMNNPGHEVQDDLSECIFFLSGASSLEELDEREYERYLSLHEHPLMLNLCSRSSMLSSGLMSRYQVASLCDYREREGDVLSAVELSLVSGFSKQYVQALLPFVDFSTRASPGQSSLETQGPHHIESRSRFALSQGSSYLQKLRLSKGEALQLSFSAQRALAEGISWPDAFGLSCSGQWKGLSLVVGDFNAHFGQGLSFWSGFSLSSISSVNSLLKKQFGGSAYWGTSSSSLQGVCLSYDFSRLKPTLFYDWRHGNAGANVIYFWRSGQLGVTAALADKNLRLSSDLRWNIRGWDTFAEYSFNLMSSSSAVLAGTASSLGERCRLGINLRSYGEDFGTAMAAPVRSFSNFNGETGGSVCVELSGKKWVKQAGESVVTSLRKSTLSLALDYGMKPSDNTLKEPDAQLKGLLIWDWHPSPTVSSKLRSAIRMGSSALPVKTELRELLSWSDGKWGTAIRVDWLHARSDAFMIFLEQTLMTDFLKLRLREEIFHVDNWDDRIYVYEYDVPGCFNVPALYGRGYALSALCGWKVWDTGKLWLKLSLQSYKRGEELFLKPLVRIQLDINQRLPR